MKLLPGPGALLRLTLVALLAAPALAAAEGRTLPDDPKAYTAEDIQACVQENVPERTSEQHFEFTSVDRVGSERSSRAEVFGKRFEDGLRRVLLKFARPDDLRGSAFLMIEHSGGTGSDMFLYSPELRKVKRLSGTATASSLFGTDFSAEDFERLQGINRPGELRRLEDDEVDGRAAWRLETLPTKAAESAYTRIVTFVDQERCIALRTESYETGDRLRKVLTADPESIERFGDIWVPQKMVMRDERDQTHTRLEVDEVKLDDEIRDQVFSLSTLERGR